MVRQTFREIKKKLLAYRLPKVLLLNNVRLDVKHLDDVLEETRIEREWYQDEKSFRDRNEILRAVKAGTLVKIEGNQNYLPIMRYRNPTLVETYPPFLRPSAKGLLDEVGKRWREAWNAAGFDPQVRMSVTSLLRTAAYQKAIVDAGKLADPKSVHTKGEAFDIEARGYYCDETPVNGRAARHGEFHDAFKNLGAEQSPTQFANYDDFEPKYQEILQQILEAMMLEGKIHYVLEYPDTTNATFHICRNPEYQPPDKIAT
ncbi:hypothetical protein HY346_02510 [Candidatus Microgenomates bacterium]|nr:hypothetical protein [Candidatus Microgenomates bacterium]